MFFGHFCCMKKNFNKIDILKIEIVFFSVFCVKIFDKLNSIQQLMYVWIVGHFFFLKIARFFLKETSFLLMFSNVELERVRDKKRTYKKNMNKM